MPPPMEPAASAPAAAPAPMEEEEPPELAGERKLAEAAAPRAKDTFVAAASKPAASKPAGGKPRGGREGGRAALGALDANRTESGNAQVAKPKRRCAPPRPRELSVPRPAAACVDARPSVALTARPARAAGWRTRRSSRVPTPAPTSSRLSPTTRRPSSPSRSGSEARIARRHVAHPSVCELRLCNMHFLTDTRNRPDLQCNRHVLQSGGRLPLS